jgi:hypothetical protein
MPTAEEVHQYIQQRAYALWQQRSPSDGDAVSDWLRAEAEVLEQCHAALRTDEGSETAEPTRRAKKRTNATRER